MEHHPYSNKEGMMGAPDLSGHKDIRRETDRWRAKETATVDKSAVKTRGCKNMMAKS